MKLRDAEKLLKIAKDKGPLTERWWCETDEGILLEAWPLGFARGAFKLSDVYTVVPKATFTALFEGGYIGEFNSHNTFNAGSPRKLWEQEAFVYYRELRELMKKALAGLETAPMFPREGEYDFEKGRPIHGVKSDLAPHPEDFELFPKKGKQGETDGQRKAVRVRRAVPSQADQGSSGEKRVAEVPVSGEPDDYFSWDGS